MANTVKINFKGEFDSSGIKNFVNEVNKQLDNVSISKAIKKDLKNNLSDITKTLNKVTNFNFNTKDPTGYGNLLKELETNIKKVQTQIQGLTKKDFVLNFETEDIKNARKNIEEMEERLQTLKANTNINLTKSIGASDLPSSIKKSITSLDELNKVVNEIKNETQNVSLDSFLSPKASSRYSTYIQNIDKTKQKILEIQEIINKTVNSSNKEKTAAAKDAGFANFGDMKKQLSAMQQAEKLYDSANQKLKEQRKEYQKILETLQEISKINSSSNDSQYDDLTKQISEAKIGLDKLIDASKEDLFKDQTPKIQKMTESFKGADKAIGQAEKGLEEYNEEVREATVQEISQQIDNIAARWLALDKAVDFATRKVKEAWDMYKTLDTQVTGIAMVTGSSLEEAWGEVQGYTELARRLGTTTSDIAKQSEEFYRQGLNQAETMKMIEATTVMASIANMDFAESIDYMTSAINGFKLSSDDAMMISDMFSKLDASAAVSVEDLAISLSKTASIAKNAGMEVSTTAAFLTKMLETTQEAPENIGTAMKSIIARMQELKESPMKLLEDGVSANKAEEALRTAGVELRDINGEFRDLDDVILELNANWDNLSRNTQRYIATIVAGNRQQSRFLALMDDYDRTVELVNIANNSAGTSSVAFQKKLDSLNAAINKLKTSFEAFYLNEDATELFTNAANAAAELIQTLADFGAVNTAVAGGVIFLLAKLTLFSVSSNIASIAAKKLSAEMLNTELAGNVVTKTLGNLAESFLGAGKGADTAKTAILGLSKSATSLGIFAAIAVSIGAFIYLATKAEREIRKFNEELQELKANSTESEKEANDLKVLVENYEELNSIKNRTTEQNEQLKSSIESLANTYPELIESYDSEGNAILKNSEELQKYIALKEKEAAIDKILASSKTIEGYTSGLGDSTQKAAEQGRRELAENRDNLETFAESQNLKTTTIVMENGLMETFFYTKEAFKVAVNNIDKAYQEGKSVYEYAEELTGEESVKAAKQYADSIFKTSSNLAELAQEESRQALEQQAQAAADYLIADSELQGKVLSDAEKAIIKNMASLNIEESYEKALAAQAAGDENAVTNFFSQFITESDDAVSAAKKAAELAATESGETFLEVFERETSGMSTKNKELLSSLISGPSEEQSIEEYESEVQRFMKVFNPDSEIYKQLSNSLNEVKQIKEDINNELINLLDVEGLEGSKLENLSSGFKQVIIDAISVFEDPAVANQVANAYAELYSLIGQLPEKDKAKAQQIIGSINPEDIGSIIVAKQELADILNLPVSDSQITTLFEIIGQEAEASVSGLQTVATEIQSISELIQNSQEIANRNATGSLTAEDVELLTILDDSLTAADFEGTANGLKLVSTSVEALTAKYLDNQRQIYETQKAETELKLAQKESIEVIQEKIDYLEKMPPGYLKDGQSLEQLKAEKAEILNLQDSIDELALKIKAMPKINLFEQSFSQLDGIVNQVQGLGSIMQEQTEKGQISFNNALSLIQQGYADLITIQGNVITLNQEAVDSIIDSEQKKFQVQIGNAQKAVQAQILQLDTEIDISKRRVEIAKDGLKNSLDSEFEFAKTLGELNRTGLENYTVNEQGKIEVTETSAKDRSTIEGNYLTWLVDENGKVNSELNESFKSYVGDEITGINDLINAWNNYWVARNTGEGTAATQTETSQFKAPNYQQGAYKDTATDYFKQLDDIKSKYDSQQKTPEQLEQEKQLRQEILDQIIETEQKNIENNEAEKERLQTLYDQLGALGEFDVGSLIQNGGDLADLADDAEEAEEAISELSSELDELQNALSTMEKAVEEFNVNGHISVDTFQELMSLQPQYLAYLIDESGNLNINTEAMHQLIAAKIEEMALEKARVLVAEISNALTENNIALLYQLAGSAQVAAGSLWGLVQAQLAAQKAQLDAIDPALYQSYANQITALEKLSHAAINGIGKETITAEEAYDRLEEKQREAEERERERQRQEEERKRLIDKMENALLNALIARDEKIVENQRKKYEKMKQLDNDYLESVRRMREKEKALRESEEELESLSKMKQRLALLERDTSGAYAKEIAELKEQIREKEEQMSEDAKDQAIENLEEEVEKTHETYDKEIEAMEKANEAKKENMQLYWDEVNKIMDQGVDAMLDTLMKYDESFQDMSARQKEAWISEMTEAANAVMGIFNSMSSAMGGIEFGSGGGYGGGISMGDWDDLPSSTGKNPVKRPGTGGSSGGDSGSGTRFSGPIYGTYDDARKGKNGMSPTFGSGPYVILSDDGVVAKVRYYKNGSGVTGYFPSRKAYKNGGLVDFTGPAWVDGSKSKPEAFLSAKDTNLIQNFMAILTKSKALLDSSFSNNTYEELEIQRRQSEEKIQVDIHVDKISSDYDVQKMVEAVKREIVSVSKYRNTVSVGRVR